MASLLFKNALMEFQRKAHWINVVGIWYPNSDGSCRMTYIMNWTKEDKLKLIREPNNIYDQYAIKIIYGDNKQIGYIPREKSKLISDYLDAGYNCEIKNLSILRDDFDYGLHCGITLIVTA